MEAGSRDITKRGFVFVAPPPALPVLANTKGKNNKKYDGGLSFGTALLVPPNSRGVDGFSFGSSSSSVIHGGTRSVSGDKVAEEKEEDTSSAPAAGFSFVASSATTPAVVAYDGAATVASGLSFVDDPFFSMMSLSNKGAEAEATASAPDFLFGWPPRRPPPPLPPAYFRLGIGPGLLVRHRNFLTMWQR